MILGKPFFPKPDETRMGNAGNVAEARRYYYEEASNNLRFLIRHRYEWINSHINPATDEGVEFGCGIGVGKDFVRAGSLAQTDFSDGEWLDVPRVDALNTPFENERFDFAIIINTLHHLAQPVKFFDEAARILKPGGKLFIRDVKCSLVMRAILRLMRVEGYSFEADVYDRAAVLSDPDNLWEANNAICNLFFEDIRRFHAEVPQFKVLSQFFDECLVFLNSGGVTNKTISVPLPPFALNALRAADNALTRAFPNTFAIQRSLVLQKQ